MGDQWGDGEANDPGDGLTQEDYDFWLWTDELDDGTIDLREFHPSVWMMTPVGEWDDDWNDDPDVDWGDGWYDDGDDWEDDWLDRWGCAINAAACVLSAVGAVYLVLQVIRWARGM